MTSLLLGIISIDTSLFLVRFQGLSSSDSFLAMSERLGRWDSKANLKRRASSDDASFSRSLESLIVPSDLTSESFMASSSGKHLCKYCGKDLHFASRLREHLRTHTGERPYQCTLCNYRATQSGSLTRHIKSVHHKDPMLLPDFHDLPDS